MEGSTGFSCAPDAVVSQSSVKSVGRKRELRSSEQTDTFSTLDVCIIIAFSALFFCQCCCYTAFVSALVVLVFVEQQHWYQCRSHVCCRPYQVHSCAQGSHVGHDNVACML